MKKPRRERSGAVLAKPSISDISFVFLRIACSCSGSQVLLVAVPSVSFSICSGRLAQRRFLLALAHPLGLLLLNPVPRAFDAVAAQHPRACLVLHALEAARNLIGPPIAAARDEDRRNVDRPAGEQLQLGVVGAGRPAAVPIETALEAGPLILRAVYPHLVLCHPSPPPAPFPPPHPSPS